MPWPMSPSPGLAPILPGSLRSLNLKDCTTLIGLVAHTDHMGFILGHGMPQLMVSILPHISYKQYSG